MNSIYQIKNIKNGKIYLGKTSQNPKNRLEQHFASAFKNDSQYLIHKAMRKYGRESFSFEVIFNTFDENDLSNFEKFFIAEFKSCILEKDSYGYNMTRGGDGFTSETGRKYAGWNNPGWINPWSGEKGSEMSSRKNKERAQTGANPWAGESGSKLSKEICAKQVASGTHPFQGEQGSILAKARNKKLFEEGKHLNQIQHTCPACGKTGTGRAMFRWHFKNCKRNESLQM